MTTTHDHTRTQIAVEASKLWVKTANSTTVWKSEEDLWWVIKEGFRRSDGIERASERSLGQVLVLLGIDAEDDFHEVMTNAHFSVGHVATIEAAIEALQAARDGILHAQQPVEHEERAEGTS